MADESEGNRHLALADEAYRAFDVDAVATHLSAAIRAFTAGGDNRQAAMACVRLGNLFANYLNNQTAARAWFVRAARMVENEPPCVEQGWVAVASLGCDVDDPEVLLAGASLALERARQFGDVNLETKALADAGLAHVQAGRVTEGMQLLDEAMALACGPADDNDSAGKSVCSFFTACYFACDFDRAQSWVDTLTKRGLIGTQSGVQVFLASHCDAVQATLLGELGRWGEAEAMLLRASELFEETTGSQSWHPAIALAELRIRQGRLADAEQLLLGKEGRFQALLPAARLHLTRGDFELARATAERGLRAIGNDRLRAAELLALLIDVELGIGDRDAAAALCKEMVARAQGLGVPALEARVASARARALAACGEIATAITTIEVALDALPQAGVPYLRASLLIDLVRLHEAAGNVAAAKVEAARAHDALRGLDVVVPADDLALLDRAEVGGAASASPAVTVSATAMAPATATIAKDGSGWLVSYGDTRAKLAASKGMSYVVELVRNAGVERHALDLVDRVEGVSVDGIDRRQLGDAGDLLDGKARTAYRHRIEELRSEIDDAMASEAFERGEQLEAELDQLVAELARAFGVGGRERKAGSAAERARLNVTRALRTAVARIRDVLPEAGDALDRGLRTGLYCSFTPAGGDDGITWAVKS